VSVRIDVAAPAATPVDDVPKVNQPIGDVDEFESSPLDESTARTHRTRAAKARPGRATVLVRVPRSYFVRLFRAAHPNQTPTPDDLGPLVIRVGESIRSVVQAMIPPDELADLKIDRIDDFKPEQSKATREVLADGAPRRFPGWLPLVGGFGLAVAVLGLLGGAWLAARRPGRRVVDSGSAMPVLNDADASARAVDRLRELMQASPPAAAAVLHRWIAQGGHTR
jgi:hypothetical protein